ncbi:orotate phosphoribosyltransferase [Neolewinella lacunae]|uniref:Orotate phosphoribosyltransferase n=1 Tax=Neolewinella lacunae TaxID=1517758 RepID=A0A923T8Z7_9BACT|nr:orotate phosphoribosyltransferase [Neolewinella lacunae]MBC6996175.1 orotate phosphoribosyltransferase [Neolewinella lacunae]MDN3634026.1 orotate phosphoribosyltransferase [Neolewinella lacunae]
MSTASLIARRLLEAGAVKLQPSEPFTWASGLRSPIYCDNRVLLSYPTVRTEVVAGLVELAGQFPGIEGIAGVATAGIPHGALLADRLGLPFVYIRSKAKEHGQQNQIEGRIEPGQRYLVVEDLISTGGSALQAIAALRAAGGEAIGALAIFSYEFPAAVRAFEQADVPLATLSNYSSLLAEAAREGQIAKAEAEALTEWASDPRAWSDAFSAARQA